MSENTINVEQQGRVLIARLSNPPHNFMNGRMVAELEALVGEVEQDGGIGAVVITGGRPESFLTHYDVEEILAASEAFGRAVPGSVAAGALRATGALSRIPGGRGALGRTPAAGAVELRRIHDTFTAIGRSSKPYVAAINGVATGGGCELALACDIRLISDAGGPIGLPEISVGIIPGAGGTQRLARAIGQAKAIEMILEARALEPEAALEIGLVNRVVKAEELLEEALATAGRLARRAPATVAAAKRAVYEGGSEALAAGLHIERTEFLSICGAPAAIAGMRGYLAELERLGGPPWKEPDVLAPWQEGTAVDLVNPAA
jgi:enoyl-CoA hydratase